jgi:tyrosine-protein phosphatase SIW14
MNARLPARRALIALALAGFLGGGAFFTLYDGRPQAAPVGLEAARVTDDWLSVVEGRAQPGYWLVVRGTHPGDQAVAAASSGELTHAAIYDAERGEVIEAVGAGVLRTPVRELLAQARRLVIVRPRDYSPDVGAAAVARARTRVGFGYDWLGVIGLQSDRRFYCTELVIDAYDARAKGWMPAGVIHPEHVERYGTVVFDSGVRADAIAATEVADELRARFASLLPGAKGVDYAALVAPGLYRGGVPDKEGVAWLKENGIRTVVNLRHYHGEGEGELVRAAGMNYVRIPLESTDSPAPEQIAAFLETVSDPANQPVYVHCLHGVDRTGAMIAAYRIQVQGWKNSEALAEMEHFGAHGILRDLRKFVGAFVPKRAEDVVPAATK